MKEEIASGESPGSTSEALLVKERLYVKKNWFYKVGLTGLSSILNAFMRANMEALLERKWPGSIDCRGGVICGRHC